VLLVCVLTCVWINCFNKVNNSQYFLHPFQFCYWYKPLMIKPAGSLGAKVCTLSAFVASIMRNRSLENQCTILSAPWWEQTHTLWGMWPNNLTSIGLKPNFVLWVGFYKTTVCFLRRNQHVVHLTVCFYDNNSIFVLWGMQWLSLFQYLLL